MGLVFRSYSIVFKLGLDYPYNEYKTIWKMGGQPLVHRLADKGHSWEDLRSLIPQMVLEGIMGYPFSCPDMIGGSYFLDFLKIRILTRK